MTFPRRATALLLVLSVAPAQGPNLVRNGGAETLGGLDGWTVVPAVPEWALSGDLNVADYVRASPGGWLGPGDPGPPNRGRANFTGGFAGVSSGTQALDVSGGAATIDAGLVGYEVAAWLGGFGSQDDNARVTVDFQDAAGTSLATDTLGPVLAAGRGFVTALVHRTSTGAVPPLTRSLVVTLTITRVGGTANDGYADNLTLFLTPDPLTYPNPVPGGIGAGTTGIPANANEGGPFDVLSVNGEVGGVDRKVEIASTDDVVFRMANSSIATDPLGFAIFGFSGVPTNAQAFNVPTLGTVCFPPAGFTAHPASFRLTDNLGLGPGFLPSVPALAPTATAIGGWSFTLPALNMPFAVTLQGVQWDTATNVVSFTNALVIEAS